MASRRQCATDAGQIGARRQRTEDSRKFGNVVMLHGMLAGEMELALQVPLGSAHPKSDAGHLPTAADHLGLRLGAAPTIPRNWTPCSAARSSGEKARALPAHLPIRTFFPG